jgi:hypothetical protein
MGRRRAERKRKVAMDEGGEAGLRARVEKRAEALAQTFDAAAYSGRGIVIAAGGARLFVNVYVLVHLLRRRLGCTAPIEVWHYGDGELSPRMRALLAELDVKTLDAARLAAKAGVTIRDGWQLKSLILVGTRFAEVLLLDADQAPIVDPCVAFDWPQYLESGAVFWPDIVDIRAENPIWAALGLLGERTVSLESGQVLVDKRRHLRAALATLALNEAAETTYRYVYGDKDTFLLGWRLVGAPFALIPHRPFIEERSLIQRDFDGVAFLQHRTNCKWTYSGEQYAFKAAVHQEACLAALSELRRLWNGRVFNPPPRGASARRVEAWLMGALRLRCETVAEDSFSLEFWPDGELGEGRSHDRANWSVEDDPASASGIVLTIWGANGRPAYRLRHEADGIWRGERLRFPAMPVAAILEPIAIPPAPAPGARRSLVDDFLAAAEFAGEGDDAELGAALVLLSRVEADVAARLRVLARAEGAPPERAVRLEGLAAAIGDSRRPPFGDVFRDLDLLNGRYVRVPELPQGGDSLA